MKELSFWYCYICHEELMDDDVSDHRTHIRCGSEVDWVTINVPETAEEDDI